LKEIKKKISPKYFKEVAEGKKDFEIRKDDSDYEVGDILILEEYDPDKVEGIVGYTGKWITKRIKYKITHEEFPQGIQEGYCILGLEEIESFEERYKEILIPFMKDLESELKGFEREFKFDFAIKNLIKRYENQKESLKYWREKYPNEF
jgi:hypothetical protein